MASGSTPVYNLPYPLNTDPVDVAADIQESMERVEALIQLVPVLSLPNTFINTNIFFANSEDTAVRITQVGTGDVLRVEDSSNPDITPFIITNNGNTGIGIEDPDGNKLSVLGTTNLDGLLFVGTEAKNDTFTIGTFSIAITNKERTAGNVVRITTDGPHGLSQYQKVVIALTTPDATYDGQHYIDSVPTSNTFTYISTGTNLANSAATGTVSTIPGYTNPVASFWIDANDYSQISFRNASDGNRASTDLILYCDNGNDFSGAMDFGVTSSGFNDPAFTITGPNDGYIFYSAPVGTDGNGDLVIATDLYGQRNAIIFAAGGLQTNNTQMTIIPDTVVHIEIATESTNAQTGALTVTGGLGVEGALSVDGLIRLTNTVYIGQDAEQWHDDAALVNSGIVFELNGQPYAQIAIHNYDVNSSSDFVAYSDDGIEEYGFIDFGINSSDFDQALYGITGPHDGYIFMEASRPGIQDITFKAKAGGVATITTAQPHGWTTGNVVIITDVGSDYDGKRTLLSGSGNIFTFATTAGTTATTAVTNGLVHKPVGPGNLVFATGANGLQNRIVFAAGGFTSGLTQMYIEADKEVHIAIPTPSVSPITGALTVVGGVGILGDMNIQGNVSIAGTITFGGSGTTVETANLAVTDPAVFVGSSNQSDIVDLGLYVEYAKTTTAIVKDITNKELTNNIAKLTTSSAHTYIIGDIVTVSGVDSTFNGTYNILAVPSNTTFTYAKTNANISSTAVSPTGTASVGARRKFGGIVRDATDGIYKIFYDATTKPTNTTNFAEAGLLYGTLQIGALTTGPITATGSSSIATLSLTNALSAASGGTGFATYNVGDMLYAATANTFSKLSVGTNGQILIVSGGVPTWQNQPTTLPTFTGNIGKLLVVNSSLLPEWSNTVIANSATAQGLIVKAFAAQSASLQEWQDTSGNVLAKINSTGAFSTAQTAVFGGAASTSLAMITNYITAAGTKGTVTRAASSQTANMEEWQNNAGTALAYMTAAGNFVAVTKSFEIDHPTKPDMRLRYASLEGPENGVYVRGTTTERIIELPDYWTGLIDEESITVNLTAYGSRQKIYVEKIENNKVYIGGELEKAFFTVYGERKDVDKLVVEY